MTEFNASAQLNPAVIATSMMASNNDNRDSILEAGAIGGTRALELILQNFTNEGRDVSIRIFSHKPKEISDKL